VSAPATANGSHPAWAPEKDLSPSDVRIGTQEFIDDQWGNTLSTASRMVSYAVAGGIQVTEAPYERLRDKYLFEHRGANQYQGKGEMVTVLRTGRK
jgi:adenylate cyclase